MALPDFDTRREIPIHPNCRDLIRAESGSKYTSGSVSLGDVDGTTDLPEMTENLLCLSVFSDNDLAFCRFALLSLALIVPMVLLLSQLSFSAASDRRSISSGDEQGYHEPSGILCAPEQPICIAIRKAYA
jgi:hypothetical protein